MFSESEWRAAGLKRCSNYLIRRSTDHVTPERMIEVPLCKRRTVRMTAETLRTTLSNLLYDLQVSAERGRDA